MCVTADAPGGDGARAILKFRMPPHGLVEGWGGVGAGSSAVASLARAHADPGADARTIAGFDSRHMILNHVAHRPFCPHSQ